MEVDIENIQFTKHCVKLTGGPVKGIFISLREKQNVFPLLHLWLHRCCFRVAGQYPGSEGCISNQKIFHERKDFTTTTTTTTFIYTNKKQK